jgi:hypothetical protein
MNRSREKTNFSNRTFSEEQKMKESSTMNLMRWPGARPKKRRKRWTGQ